MSVYVVKIVVSTLEFSTHAALAKLNLPAKGKTFSASPDKVQYVNNFITKFLVYETLCNLKNL